MSFSATNVAGEQRSAPGGKRGFRALGPLPARWRSLARAFVEEVRNHWGDQALCDGTGANLTYGQSLVRATVLGRFLARTLGDEPYVGVLLPPTVPAAVTNLALVLQGKIPVNLNYTAGQGMIDSAIRQCAIRHVLTSPKVLDRFHVAPNASLIMLEDVGRSIRTTDKLAGACLAHLVRFGVLGQLLPGLNSFDLDSIATVIFTSGSTGDPKGVVLTHRNILSNVQQASEHIQLAPDEVILGILPFFHSFGFTVTIWMALALGKKVVYHFNPLDARTIGKLCEEHRVTLIAGTPSFTRFYIKACPPEQFKTLTHLILGAEKLKPELYRDITNWLDIEPMEGYGTTELSPVVAANVPREVVLPDGRRIHGNRPGTVGLPVPGTSIKTVDPDTGEDLPDGAEGVVAVKGPQVMAGYLNDPEATAKVLKDGWYFTGDLGFVDPDGFLKITDRLSRFSKIAGEMVPHVGVESAIMGVTGVDEHHVAVTSLPDPKHGERLCVVHTELGMSPDDIHRALTASRIPRLWIPSVRDFVAVPEIPITGTGKVDLRALREVARCRKCEQT
jgi:acyl-[acyl-carrier-protein]-phospholipid O-acyltransferase/long-chain-fatty-acid--[acyl-carrier-protein] ligase